MARWLIVGCGVVAAAFVALGLAAAAALWQGASIAARLAGAGIEHARTALEQAAPPEARDRLRAQLDEAVAALRDGRFDGDVLSETAWWLPAALADGRLDAEERKALWDKLDRLVPEGPGEGAPASARAPRDAAPSLLPVRTPSGLLG